MKKNIILALALSATFGLNAAVTQDGDVSSSTLDGACNTNPPGTDLSGGKVFSATFAESGTISDANVAVNISHTWIGDLAMEVTYNGTTALLHDVYGNGDADIDVTYDSEAGTACADQCLVGSNGCAAGASCAPPDSLAGFNGMNSAMGSWDLRICDRYPSSDTGTINSYSVTLDGDNPLPVELMNLSID